MCVRGSGKIGTSRLSNGCLANWPLRYAVAFYIGGMIEVADSLRYKNCVDCSALMRINGGAHKRCTDCSIIARKVSCRKNSIKQSAKAKNKREISRGCPSRYGTAKKSTALSLLKYQRKLIFYINVRLDKIEKQLAQDYYTAMHLAWVEANQQALQRDKWRRSKKRRRQGDTTMDRGNMCRPSLWLTSMRRFGFCCAYCNLSAHESDKRGFGLQLDHLLPVGNHSANDPSNAVPACIWCNASKGNRDVLDWAASKGLALSNQVLHTYAALVCPYAA